MKTRFMKFYEVLKVKDGGLTKRLTLSINLNILQLNIQINIQKVAGLLHYRFRVMQFFV